MKENGFEEGRFSTQGQGLGTVSEEMVRCRAAEIAVVNGRERNQVLDSDLDEAYRELTGAERLNPPPPVAEELTEDQRWEGVAGTQGQKAPTVAASDEQTFRERLVEEGVADAEHDQAFRATKENLKRDTES